MTTRPYPALGWIAALALVSCGGDGEDLSETDAAGVTLVNPANGILPIALPTRPGQVPNYSIEFASSGDADLVIESAAWVGERPSGVVLQASRAPSTEAECGGVFLPSAGMGECVTDGAPSFDEPVPPRASENVLLFVKPFEAGQTPNLGCPAAPEDVPEDVRERYCGAIRFVTNGSNDVDSAGIEQGDFTVYLVTDSTADQINVSPSQIRFDGVSPGFSGSLDFTVTNNADTPVEISSVQPLDKVELINIEPFVNDPITLQTGQAQTFTAALTIPAGAGEGSTSFSTEIEISYGDGATFSLPLVVDDTRAVLPIPQSDVRRLEFLDGSTSANFTLTNPGTEAVTITQVAVRSARAGASVDPSDFYAVTRDDGTEARSVVILDASPSVPDRNTHTFTVTYTPPADASVSPLALLEARYNYEANGSVGSGSLTIALLGDRTNVPFGVLAPDNVIFGHDTSAAEAQVKRVALANIGTAPLVVDDLPFGGEAAEFDAALIAGTSDTGIGQIAPGEVGIIEVRQSSPDTMDDDIILTVSTNSAVPVDSIGIRSVAKPPVGADVVIAAEPASPAVGDVVTLALSGATVAADASPVWVLTDQPEGSEIYFAARGPRYAFVPKVAGTYRFFATTLADALTAQPPSIFELTVSP